MTIDDLLMRWARWRSVRDDGGLGYSSNALNRMMAGEVNTGCSAESSLPYGVDADSVFSNVDSAVCRLPDVFRLVVERHYFFIGDEAAKARAFGVCGRTYRRYMQSARQLLFSDLRDGVSGIDLTGC